MIGVNVLIRIEGNGLGFSSVVVGRVNQMPSSASV